MLSVIVTVAAPSDAPRFDAEATFRDLAQALQPLVEQNLIALSRCSPSTENELKRRLSERQFQVLHFIGHGRAGQAQYASLLFENSAKATRALSAQYLAGVLQKASVGLAVLQPTGEQSFAQCVETIAGGSLAAVATPRMEAKLATLFARVFYARLANGGSPEEALADVREALAARGADAGTFSLRGGQKPVGVAPALGQSSGQAPVGPAPAPPVSAPTPVPETTSAETAAKNEIERKRAAGTFDVFLCHNWSDKAAVKKIAKSLKARGILPWLDEWELPPGQPWQPLLEQQIGEIKSAAVFVGKAGIGPWQEQELNGFLREFVARKSPVIPVLLFDAPEKPELPIFLRAMTWVDFRLTDPDPLERLVWGITGRRAGD
ncbi:MAG: TIR domain-containing protein [Burkholderiales bacterium]